MSQAQPLHLHAQRKHEDNQANAMKDGRAPGTGDKLGHGHHMKDEKNTDVDTIASEFINLKHRAWALQKSTTMYPAST
ncbi:hypothetical protein PVAP13_5NG646200 [Panicum virgatum]|uniref:Uncharacterized protein n=1 Tax=Panicum virgatum TaxID=38727 RepID=A0A8T0SBE7_PANVG|nr:hypothetical protein PVAP13_5NG646200 [Panicum virgatum]